MANVILFTDRASRSYNGSLRFFNYPAGAYKIASVLREQGYSVLVVSNCLNYSWAGIKHIIQSNSRDLLWVGISTTLMFMKSDGLQDYRQQWTDTNDLTLSVDLLYNSIKESGLATELVWSKKEINLISHWLEKKYLVPLLIGGAWVTYIKNGNLNPLHKNSYLVKGYAEDYVINFTNTRSNNLQHIPPEISSNGHYDDIQFKTSKIHWHKTDFVIPQSVIPIEIARGCAFRCSYCTFPRRGIRKNYKDPEILRQELIENYERWGITKYTVMDDLYNDSKEKVRDLYDNCWSKLPFSPEWTSYMRLDLFYADNESIDIIKASGARMGNFGIETLHDKAGKQVGKGLGKHRILETLELLNQQWKDDVLISAQFIAGLPQEPLDSIKETMNWTVTTNLLYNASWAPLWVHPPENFKIITQEAMDNISQDNDKFGVKWLSPQNWINGQKVTFQEVDKLVAETMNKMPFGMSISWSDYSDLRTGGLTHEQIANIHKFKNGHSLLEHATQKIISLIDWRINQVLSLSDH